MLYCDAFFGSSIVVNDVKQIYLQTGTPRYRPAGVCVCVSVCVKESKSLPVQGEQHQDKS